MGEGRSRREERGEADSGEKLGQKRRKGRSWVRRESGSGEKGRKWGRNVERGGAGSREKLGQEERGRTGSGKKLL